MFRTNSWARGPGEEHTRLHWGFCSDFRGPFMDRAGISLAQATASCGRHLLRRRDTSLEAEPHRAWRKGETGQGVSEEAPVGRGVNPQKARVWERVRQARKGGTPSKSALHAAVESPGLLSTGVGLPKPPPQMLTGIYW